MPKPTIDDLIYLGDNGVCACKAPATEELRIQRRGLPPVFGQVCAKCLADYAYSPPGGTMRMMYRSLPIDGVQAMPFTLLSF